MALIILGWHPTEARAGNLTVSDTLDLFGGALGSIRSFDVMVSATSRRLIVTEGREDVDSKRQKKKFVIINRRELRAGELPQTSHEYFHQVFQRGKGRIEYLDGPKGKAVRYLVYDEETAKSWVPAQRAAAIDRPPAAPVMGGMDYRECYRNVVWSAALMKCLRERTNVKLIPPVPDSPFVILETDPLPQANIDLPTFGFRIAIDPRRNFMPAVVEIFRPIAGKPFMMTRREVVDWKDLGGGLWVPTKVVSRHFDSDPDWKETFGHVHSEVVMQIDLTRSSWNKNIPEEVFTLPLPVGAVVTDFRRKVQYVTGKPDAGKNLEELAAHARDMVPIRLDPPAEKSSPRPVIIAGSAAAFTLIVVVAVGWRLRRRIRGA
jgi:hypothetical protein